MSDCEKCIFKDVYRDMGASMEVCSLVRDLNLSIAELRFYRLCKTCKRYLSVEGLLAFAKNNTKDDVSDVFNYIMLNKELKK